MPWMNTNKVDEKRNFVAEYLSGRWGMGELCERYGVSRPTGYRWVGRFKEEGEAGLEERSHEPKRVPHRTAPEVEARIVELRREYGWGGETLRMRLRRELGEEVVPALSTVNAILGRNGLLRRARRRRHWPHPGSVPVQTERPNQVWPADFKGQFRMGNGRYCYPLTVTDHYSRRLLMCQGLLSTRGEAAQPAFRRLFREAGLPEAIRTDNGAPFVTHAICGFSRLSIWWMQLGIIHQRTRPASPQENGQHERMHKDLKRDATRPPGRTLVGQQRKLERFRRMYNEERPHHALDGATPAQLWEPSPRPFPEGPLAGPQYPGHLEVRRISRCGAFRLNHDQIALSKSLVGLYVAFDAVDDGLWDIFFYKTRIGRFDERERRVFPA
jgi:transposase InsO family protein